ncbi:MAG: poly-gamma-glutamate synthase PgsB [Bacilli bacterium]|nr:poly-gamma-glutamate synthase PgsB [Bacilli bacterium]
MRDITEIVVISFLALAICYLIIEQVILMRLRKHFKVVIHVNGTRGKSTVSRYMDAILREAGYHPFTKTTGTLPMMRYPDGHEEVIHRWGRANIREQMKMMWKAYRHHADALILECMAVDPLLQWHTEAHILRADINIITNVRRDHLDLMGESLEAIATSLGNTASKNTIVVTADAMHADLIEKAVLPKGASFVFAPSIANVNMIPLLQENISVAVKTAQILGISEDIALHGIESYHPDPGAFIIESLGQMIFINALSANDPDSTMELYRAIESQFAPKRIALLVNNRADRPTRTLQSIAFIQAIKPHCVYIAGDNAYVVKKKVEKIIKPIIYRHIEDILNEEVVFAFGNIGGQGFKILKACEEWRKHHGH